jgi:cell wall-associated NlpC family hydrolase
MSPGKTWRKIWLPLLLFLAGCATQPRFDLDGFHDDSSFATRQRILSAAESLVGTPYLPGGETPAGMDCSGLVQYTYHQAGVQVPRTTDQLYQAGYHRERIIPGDLLFFRTTGWGIAHVGIYAGNGQMIHVSASSAQVRKVSVHLPYWQERFLGSASFLNCPGQC